MFGVVIPMGRSAGRCIDTVDKLLLAGLLVRI